MFNVSEDGSIGMNFGSLPSFFQEMMKEMQEQRARLAEEFPDGIKIEYTDGSSAVIDTTP